MHLLIGRTKNVILLDSLPRSVPHVQKASHEGNHYNHQQHNKHYYNEKPLFKSRKVISMAHNLVRYAVYRLPFFSPAVSLAFL